MKYIIAIDEELKKTIDETSEPSIIVSLCSHTIGEAIKNGTPLEEEFKKIKAEMDNKGWYNRYDKEQFVEIIDKYIF